MSYEKKNASTYSAGKGGGYKKVDKSQLTPIKDLYPKKDKSQLTPIKDKNEKVDKNKLTPIANRSSGGVAKKKATLNKSRTSGNGISKSRNKLY